MTYCEHSKDNGDFSEKCPACKPFVWQISEAQFKNLNSHLTPEEMERKLSEIRAANSEGPRS